MNNKRHSNHNPVPTTAGPASALSYLILFAWFIAISTLPDPRPLSAPAWAVESLQSLVNLSDPVARAVTTLVLRGIGFALLGAFLVIAIRHHRRTWTIPAVLIVAPALSLGSQWILHRHFPILPQAQLSVATSLLGASIALALCKNLWLLTVPVIACAGLFFWGTSTAVNDDLATAAHATGQHVLAMASGVSVSDSGEHSRDSGGQRFVELTRIAFEYAEDNSHGTDPVFANKAAILALAIILGEERLASRAKRGLALGDASQLAAIRNRTTLRGRHDLSRHFWVSAGLVILTDPSRSLTLGLGKELMDSTPSGSGFSFVDMLANRAGIRFATSATANQNSARVVQLQFLADLSSTDFLPDYAGLPEGLDRAAFQSQLGGLGGQRTREINQDITTRLKTAPALQPQIH